jgi:superfamily I DNA and/or RNA helicase
MQVFKLIWLSHSKQPTMNQKLEINNENQAIQLFSNKNHEWEDKTMSVSAIFKASYPGNITGYEIYFRGADKKFRYKEENVRILHKVRNIDIDKKDIYVDGAKVNVTKLELFGKGYYRANSEESTFFTQNVELKSIKYRNVFTYFTKLAEYAGTIAEKDSPLSFLSQNYKSITNQLHNSVLIDYLQGECKQNNYKKAQMILPFDFNQSQVKAVDAALKSNISVIEGPPGTGKTQTILNLIANIIYTGKNCAVISNNNAAIDNVYEKLVEEHIAFIAASLGNRTNVVEFFENEKSEELTSFLNLQIPLFTSSERKTVEELSVRMKKIQDMEVETFILESQLIEIQTEQRHYDNFSDESVVINHKLSSANYMSLITRLQDRRKLWFFERWILNFRFRIKAVSVDINVLLRNAEKLYYQTRISELSNKIASNKEFLKNHNKELVGKDLKLLYRKLFENHISKHYQRLTNLTFSAKSYKRDFKNFLLRYPVVLSTTQSLLNNAPKGFTFDYLIIDEASQGDLLSSTLAISCAKNLVVVGDSRQLQQIDEESLFSQSELLVKEYNVPESYRYASNSILKSVKDSIPDVPTTLLKEHYRCAPDIINFCNKMFYNGELVTMTHNTGKHIEIIKTVPGNHARRNPYGSGLYNQREIDEVENILKDNNSSSVGIISPFRYQANLITEKYAIDRIEADTIHKFQGRQKDEVILSFVVNSLDKGSIDVENRLYDFVTNDKLLNVAISRGQNKVTAIVADKVYHSTNNVINDFIKYAEYLYGSEITKDSTVTSVFDLLYSEYTNKLLLKYRARPNEHKSELLMCDLINEVLKDYGYIGYSMHTRLSTIINVPDTLSDEEKRYILHPWTHVDFLFYNKVSKEKLFVLEVDGIKYHEQDKKQAEHDEIKNRTIELNNIAIYRFKTNESNEKQRLINIIKEFSH